MAALCLLIPLHRFPFAPYRGRDLGCDCHAVRTTKSLFNFLIQHLPVFKACRLFNLLFNSPQTCNNQKVKQALQRLLTPLLLYIKTAQEIKKYLQNSQTPTCFSLSFLTNQKWSILLEHSGGIFSSILEASLASFS